MLLIETLTIPISSLAIAAHYLQPGSLRYLISCLRSLCVLMANPTTLPTLYERELYQAIMRHLWEWSQRRLKNYSEAFPKGQPKDAVRQCIEVSVDISRGLDTSLELSTRS